MERPRLQIPVLQEVSPTILNFSDKELSQHLRAYDICRNYFAGMMIAGITLIGSASKIDIGGIPEAPLLFDGVLLTSTGYLMMGLFRNTAEQAVQVAKFKGLKTVKRLFTRKLDLDRRPEILTQLGST